MDTHSLVGLKQSLPALQCVLKALVNFYCLIPFHVADIHLLLQLGLFYSLQMIQTVV